LPENEPRPRPKAPRAPLDLDKDAKKTWKQLAPILERLGLLTEVDGHTFAHLCQIRSRLISIHKRIKDELGSLVQEKITYDDEGESHIEFKPSAYVVMEKQYYQLFRQYASEFGLSPRGRVGLSIGKDDDGGDDLLT